MEAQWVQVVILTGNVEKSEPQFRFAVQKAVADERVELPEIITRQNRGVASIVLVIPQCFSCGKEAGRVIVDSEEFRLLQYGRRPLAWLEIHEN